MKVKELIAELQKKNPEQTVVLQNDFEGYLKIRKVYVVDNPYSDTEEMVVIEGE